MKQRQEKCDNKVYLKQHWNIKYTREMWLFPLTFSVFNSTSSVHVSILGVKNIRIMSRQKKKVVKGLLKWQTACNLHVKQRNLRIKQRSTPVISSCMGS